MLTHNVDLFFSFTCSFFPFLNHFFCIYFSYHSFLFLCTILSTVVCAFVLFIVHFPFISLQHYCIHILILYPFFSCLPYFLPDFTPHWPHPDYFRSCESQFKNGVADKQVLPTSKECVLCLETDTAPLPTKSVYVFHRDIKV